MPMDYAKQIAKNSFKIKGITLHVNDPVEWASGFRMPIYNDNRKQLQKEEYRTIIAKSQEEIIKHKKIKFDYIIGTPTAGLPPAATLSQRINKPMLIYIDGKYYKFDNSIPEKLNINVENYLDVDVIVSTAPKGYESSIIPSVQIANNYKLPFAYTRPQKNHGLENSLEGIVSSGQKVLLIDANIGKEDVIYAKSVLRAKGAIVKHVISENIEKYLKEVSVNGKVLLVVEDLISTAGSLMKGVKRDRENGAIINNIVSIFKYGFPSIEKKLSELGLKADSSLDYEKMLKVAIEEKVIESEQYEFLKSWNQDPFEWGEKNGFSRYSKTGRNPK